MKIIKLLIPVTAIIFSAFPCFCEMISCKESLRDIKSIVISVQITGDDIIDEDTIKADLEDKLGKEGIKVITPDSCLSDKITPDALIVITITF